MNHAQLQPQCGTFLKTTLAHSYIILANFLVLSISSAFADQDAKTTYILFLGGESAWGAGEYSQYSEFNSWHVWADKKPNSTVIPIFADGARSPDADRETHRSMPFEVWSADSNPGWLPNLRTWDPKNGEVLLRLEVKDNFGAATYPTLERAFAKAKQAAGDVFLFIGDHGASPNPYNIFSFGKGSDSPVEVKSEARDVLAKGGITLGRQDSVVIGWFGMHYPGEDNRFKELYEGRMSVVFTNLDLERLRDKNIPDRNFKFVSTQCFSGAMGWLAFNSQRTALRGDTCGVTASTYYYASSGCSPDPNDKSGFGHWASQAIEKKISLGKPGQTSIRDVYLYALAHSPADRNPQLTTELFLENAGYLPWPVESGKNLHESLEFLAGSGKKVLSPKRLDSLRVVKKAACKVNVSIAEMARKLHDQVENVLDKTPLVLPPDPTEQEILKLGGRFKDTLRRYQRYRKAEALYFRQASSEERAAYLKVKECEQSPL